MNRLLHPFKLTTIAETEMSHSRHFGVRRQSRLYTQSNFPS
jgi:hypothetical protein